MWKNNKSNISKGTRRTPSIANFEHVIAGWVGWGGVWINLFYEEHIDRDVHKITNIVLLKLQAVSRDLKRKEKDRNPLLIFICLDSITQRGEKLELLVEKTDDLNAAVSETST